MSRRRAMMAAASGGTINFVSIGTPDITDKILTPGSSGLIRTPEIFSPGNNTWKIQVGFTTGNLPTTNSVQDIVGSVDSAGASQRGALIEDAYISSISSNCSQGYLSSNGTSWDISSGAIGDRIASNTEYLMTLEFTGTQYIIRKSTDGGTTWSPITTAGSIPTAKNSTAKVKGGYYLGVGLRRNGYLTGTIDLSKVKVWINDVLWWQPYI